MFKGRGTRGVEDKMPSTREGDSSKVKVDERTEERRQSVCCCWRWELHLVWAKKKLRVYGHNGSLVTIRESPRMTKKIAESTERGHRERKG